VRVIGGKCVVNLVPLGAAHKGIAVERARTQLGCDTVLYVGDDESDEDVFGLDTQGRIVGVRVGRTGRSAARYRLRGRHEVDDLLRVLIRMREERGRRAS
jgi:trehalose 6-phosphate phosphatase